MQVRDIAGCSVFADASASGKPNFEYMEDGVYVGVEDEDDHQASIEDDGLGDIWNEMSMDVEVTKILLKPSIAKREILFFVSYLFSIILK